MKRIKVLFINVIVLTLTSLLIRTIRISFQVYLSNKMGSAGIGLFQLIMSIYFLAITFSTSGIRITTTRLVAEELAIGKGVKKAIHNCLVYGLVFSIFFAMLLYVNAQFIGVNWLGDIRTIPSLRILSLSLPFIAISSVLSGYFTAVRRVIKASAVQIAEQLVKILITVIFLSMFISRGLEYSCIAIVLGFCTGELTTALLLFMLYRLEIRRYEKSNEPSNNLNLIPRMLKIALPVAFGSYITSSIRTVQHLLIPFGLRQSGSSSENALSTYGTIHGMVMPVIMFPSVLLDIISEMVVPELAESQASGSKKRLNYIVNRVFNLGMMVSICVMCIFLRFSSELGYSIYNNGEAAYFIRIFAPIIPIMYMDSIVDGMLKGMGEQVSSMRYNIIESMLSLVLIYVLLPQIAITGYIITVYFSRGLNFFLSVNRLIKKSDLNISFSKMVNSLLCIFGSIIISNIFFYSVERIFGIIIINLFFPITFVAVTYFLLLRLSSCITHDDLLWFKAIFK